MRTWLRGVTSAMLLLTGVTAVGCNTTSDRPHALTGEREVGSGVYQDEVGRNRAFYRGQHAPGDAPYIGGRD